jgi:citrate lyase subunit beta/citryl-CoA lyase
MIAAFDLPENENKGVIQIDGRMVERLHAEMARRTVAIADAIAQRQPARTEEKTKAASS